MTRVCATKRSPPGFVACPVQASFNMAAPSDLLFSAVFAEAAWAHRLATIAEEQDELRPDLRARDREPDDLVATNQLREVVGLPPLWPLLECQWRISPTHLTKPASGTHPLSTWNTSATKLALDPLPTVTKPDLTAPRQARQLKFCCSPPIPNGHVASYSVKLNVLLCLLLRIHFRKFSVL